MAFSTPVFAGVACSFSCNWIFFWHIFLEPETIIMKIEDDNDDDDDDIYHDDS